MPPGPVITKSCRSAPTMPRQSSASSASRPQKWVGLAGSWLRPAGIDTSTPSEVRIHPTVDVSFAVIRTGRYVAFVKLCRTTSSKNHEDTISAAAEGVHLSACLSSSESRSLNATLTAVATTPVSSKVTSPACKATRNLMPWGVGCSLL